MSEEEKKEEEKVEGKPRVVKVSDLLNKPAAKDSASTKRLLDLYQTCSESLLKLHNTTLSLQQRTENFDQILVKFQQGINVAFTDINKRLTELETKFAELTEKWNQAVEIAEENQDATKEEGEEDPGSNGEEVRKEEG